MTLTITIHDDQAANGLIVSGGELSALCSRLIAGEADNWANIAASRVNTDLLAKLKAAPKELRDQIVAIKLPVADVPKDVKG